MAKNLVIVESPAKAKTIEGYLGKDFVVKSSMGHIRDLAKGNDSVDIDNDFSPKYVVSPSSKKVVTELKSLAKKAETVSFAGRAVPLPSIKLRPGQLAPLPPLVCVTLGDGEASRALDHGLALSLRPVRLASPDISRVVCGGLIARGFHTS